MSRSLHIHSINAPTHRCHLAGPGFNASSPSFFPLVAVSPVASVHFGHLHADSCFLPPTRPLARSRSLQSPSSFFESSANSVNSVTSVNSVANLGQSASPTKTHRFETYSRDQVDTIQGRDQNLRRSQVWRSGRVIGTTASTDRILSRLGDCDDFEVRKPDRIANNSNSNQVKSRSYKSNPTPCLALPCLDRLHTFQLYCSACICGHTHKARAVGTANSRLERRHPHLECHSSI